MHIHIFCAFSPFPYSLPTIFSFCNMFPAFYYLDRLMNPFSIFVIATLGAGWVYLFLMRSEPLVINGRQINTREKFLGMSAMSLIVIFFVTSVGHLLLSALGLGLVGMYAHSTARVG